MNKKLQLYKFKSIRFVKTIYSEYFNVDLYQFEENIPSGQFIFGIELDLGLIEFRQMLNRQRRWTVNPSCICSNELNPNMPNFKSLTLDSIWYWHYYSAIPKMLAIKDNKIIGFKMMKNNIFGIYEKETKYMINPPSFDQWVKPWYDMQNKPYTNLQFDIRLKDKINDISLRYELNDKLNCINLISR